MDSAGLLNRGVIIFPPEAGGASVTRPRRRTIIVTGVARSGTSMVAGTLQTAGLFMGDAVYDVVHEDSQFIHQLTTGDREALQNLIRKRNAEHEVWGFKAPNLHGMLSFRDIRLFRAPYLIAIFRDPVAVAVRERLSEHVDEAKALIGASIAQMSLIEYCARAKCPTLMLSYEKALAKPSEYAETLLRFCGIDCDPAQSDAILKQIEPNNPVYLDKARSTYEGVIDVISNGQLHGWCRRADWNTPVHLEVLADDTVIGTVLANRFRKDLAEAGLGNGNHGFVFDLDNVADIAGCRIRVKVRDKVFELENSNSEVSSLTNAAG